MGEARREAGWVERDVVVAGGRGGEGPKTYHGIGGVLLRLGGRLVALLAFLNAAADLHPVRASHDCFGAVSLGVGVGWVGACEWCGGMGEAQEEARLRKEFGVGDSVSFFGESSCSGPALLHKQQPLARKPPTTSGGQDRRQQPSLGSCSWRGDTAEEGRREEKEVMVHHMRG